MFFAQNRVFSQKVQFCAKKSSFNSLFPLLFVDFSIICIFMLVHAVITEYKSINDDLKNLKPGGRYILVLLEVNFRGHYPS